MITLALIINIKHLLANIEGLTLKDILKIKDIFSNFSSILISQIGEKSYGS